MAGDKEYTKEPEMDGFLDFCTLGMFIIDEIHYLPPQKPVYNILGGAGSYSALGARLFSPSPLSNSISWIVDAGSDFPAKIKAQVESWQTSCLIRTDVSRFTTRGWNGYDNNQVRAFKYTTPKLRLEASSLTSEQLYSKSFHLICSPERCRSLVNTILRARGQLNRSLPKPLFIWEPVPDLCTQEFLLELTNTLPSIDICSPNHTELANLMGDPDLGLDSNHEISKSAIERWCEQLLGGMPLQSYALVIRCGASGVYVAKNGGRSRRPSLSSRKTRPANRRGPLTLETDLNSLFSGLLGNLTASGTFDIEAERAEKIEKAGVDRWFPAYYRQGEESRVVDPTGGGNGFLGGMAVGLARGRSLEESVCWGSVAASFAIEQVGVPELGVGGKGKETWNGVVVEERLEEYLKRVKVDRALP